MTSLQRHGALVEAILGAVIEGDAMRAGAEFDELAGAGAADLYGLSVAAATVGRVALLTRYGGPAGAQAESLRAVSRATTTGDVHDQFAARFLGAAVRRDEDMAMALFAAADAAGRRARTESAAALLALVASLYRADPAPPTQQGETRS
ncbi:hypothetical protein [[Kitasatospora] papulosa]|uniref:hypothetical protein n=1 Tax=[Kitasatospora] papulosa TaxID=1464011 RepID=UPI00369FEE5E